MHTLEIFVQRRWHGVRYTCIRVWFSYATKFRTLRQKYEIYEIKSRMKICAITCTVFSFTFPLLEDKQKKRHRYQKRKIVLQIKAIRINGTQGTQK